MKMVELLIGELTLNTHLREAAYWVPYSDEFDIVSIRSFGDWKVYRYSLTIDIEEISYGKALALYGRLYTAFYEYIFKLIDSGNVLKPDSENPAVLRDIIKRLRELYKKNDDKDYVDIGRGRFSSNAIFHIYLKGPDSHVDIVMV